ncbi:hypothetical protein RJ640_009019 [Escallonia rubra]|uniref:Prolamin-like domain-containing protein n=1 Tax=Escallonia rubra TaxID=112253 RepID=A0AA88UNZ6_9ASTE|nr:hypothetical protein RJ640_009019 [Escallonia rubra]
MGSRSASVAAIVFFLACMQLLMLSHCRPGGGDMPNTDGETRSRIRDFRVLRQSLLTRRWPIPRWFRRPTPFPLRPLPPPSQPLPTPPSQPPPVTPPPPLTRSSPPSLPPQSPSTQPQTPPPQPTSAPPPQPLSQQPPPPPPPSPPSQPPPSPSTQPPPPSPSLPPPSPPPSQPPPATKPAPSPGNKYDTGNHYNSPSKCLTALTSVEGCIRDLIISFFGEHIILGPDCCKRIREISDGCFDRAFTQFSDPPFRDRVRDYCAH